MHVLTRSVKIERERERESTERVKKGLRCEREWRSLRRGGARLRVSEWVAAV